MRVKICGNTNLADAQEAARLGAWALGLIYAEQSPRRCDPAVAAEIGAALRRRCEIVGVFVNPTLDEVAQAADSAGFTMIQLHGDEGPAFCGEVARRTGCKVIKAARVQSGAEIRALSIFHTDYHLLDSYVEGVRGGTGETFAWELVKVHRRKTPVILSGGLNAANVGDAIAITYPFAVDVASGVESAPGIKDPAKLEAFAAAVRAATATAAPTAASSAA